MAQPVKGTQTRIIVYIEKVKLALKFNCQLSFMIKNEKSQTIAETDQTYNLIRGSCIVNKLLHFELPNEILMKQCKKLKIIVMTISANGIVSAGFVTFPTQYQSKYQQNQYSLKIERCQDNNAFIKFMHINQDSLRTTFEKSYIHNFKPKNAFHSDRILKFSLQKSKSGSSISQRKVNRKRLDFQSPSPIMRFSKNNEANTHRTRYQKQNILISQISPRKNKNQSKMESGQNINELLNETTKQDIIKENQQYWTQIIIKQQQLQKLKTQLQQLHIIHESLTQKYKYLQFQHINFKQYQQQKMQILISQIKQNSQIILNFQKKKKNQIQLELQKIKKYYQNNLQQLQNKNKILNDKINQFNIKKQQFQVLSIIKQQKNKYLQQKLQKQIQKNGILTFNSNKQQDIIDHLQKDNKQLSVANETLQAKLNNFKSQQEQFISLQNKYTELVRKFNKQLSKNSDLEQINQQLLNQIKQNKKNEDNYQEICEKLRESQQKNDYLQRQLKKVQQQSIQRLLQTQNLQQKQMNLRYDLMQKVVSLQSQLQTNNSALERQILKNQQQQQKISSLQKDNQQMKIQNQKYHSQNIEVMQFNQKLQVNMNIIQQKSNDLMNVYQKDKQRWLSDSEDKKKQIMMLKQNLNEIMKINTKLNEDLSIFIGQAQKKKQICKIQDDQNDVNQIQNKNNNLQSGNEVSIQDNASINLQIQSKMKQQNHQLLSSQAIILQENRRNSNKQIS